MITSKNLFDGMEGWEEFKNQQTTISAIKSNFILDNRNAMRVCSVWNSELINFDDEILEAELTFQNLTDYSSINYDKLTILTGLPYSQVLNLSRQLLELQVIYLDGDVSLLIKNKLKFVTSKQIKRFQPKKSS